jgi:peptide-methionine (R)-S-oxide reductase
MWRKLFIRKNTAPMTFEIVKPEEEWQQQLGPDAYHILREKGTERPFTGRYNLHFEHGIYHCFGCGTPLFESESKFESGCGWPSFDRQLSPNAVVMQRDASHGMVRTEILCGTCGGHLGHIFDDGPTETGMRYCVNSLSLRFEPSQSK